MNTDESANPSQAPEVTEVAPDLASEPDTVTEVSTETATDVVDVQQDDLSELAADGDAVVGGLEEHHVNPSEAPNEGQ